MKPASAICRIARYSSLKNTPFSEPSRRSSLSIRALARRLLLYFRRSVVPASASRRAQSVCLVRNIMRTQRSVLKCSGLDLAILFWLPLAALLALLPQPALGLGSRIPNQDPEAIARGNAFVATADNP